MKIGMVVENIPSGVISGGRYHAMFVACGLVTIGHDVTMLTNHRPRFLDEFGMYTLPKIKVTDIKNLTEGDFQLIVSYPILATLWGQQFAERLGVPHFAFVLDAENLCKKYAPAVGNRMHFGPSHTKALRDSDKILSISEHAVPFIKEWTGNENVVGLMGCVNSKVADSVQSVKRDRFVAVSRLSNHKRFSDLIYLAKELGIEIDVITSFSRREMEGRAVEAGVYRQISVWDSPDDRAKFTLMKRALALICPSAYEGLGMPMMEAVYCGTPVICYDYGVMREVCEDAALYAKWSSPESLADKVKSFLRDEYLRIDLEMAARRVGPRYSFEAMCGRLQEVFD